MSRAPAGHRSRPARPPASGSSFAEYDDGEWTGCLRLDHFGTVEECADPDGDDLATFESGEGATFGAVPAGAGLEFDDGDEVSLVDGRFFVVASEAEIQLAG